MSIIFPQNQKEPLVVYMNIYDNKNDEDCREIFFTENSARKVADETTKKVAVKCLLVPIEQFSDLPKPKLYLVDISGNVIHEREIDDETKINMGSYIIYKNKVYVWTGNSSDHDFYMTEVSSQIYLD